MATQPSRTLEAVPNQHPDRDYEVSMVVPEFTCLCPMTEVVGDFNVRGGIKTEVRAVYGKRPALDA